MKLQPDLSTVKLSMLKPYIQPRTYDVSNSIGYGSAAPGFPTHFIQRVYTQYGNDVRRGAVSEVIWDGEKYLALPPSLFDMRRNETYAQMQQRQDRFMRRLWNPLPEEDKRVQMWIEETYSHTRCCFGTAEGGMFNRGRRGYGYLCRSVDTIPSDAMPLALIVIRKYYPDHQLREDLLDKSKSWGQQDWYETHAFRPIPETCPGWPLRRSDWAKCETYHGKFCPTCGYDASYVKGSAYSPSLHQDSPFTGDEPRIGGSK